ncbi:MAG: RDD family protein [Mycobacterium sp.]
MEVGSRDYTSWGARVLAYLIDWTPITILGAVAGGALWPSTPPGFSATSDSFATAAGFLLVVYFFWNLCYRQDKTGQSIGKSVLKFKVMGEMTGQPIGFWRSFLRQLAHYVDALICSLGYLWPLWDEKGQTSADKIMATICIPTDTADP